MNRFSKSILIAAAALLPALVHAQAPIAADGALLALIGSIDTALVTMASTNPLAGLGWTLFSFFALANVVYSLTKGYMSGSGLNGVLSDLVPMAIMGAVVYGFLGGVATTAPLTVVLKETLDVIGTTVTGGAYGSSIGALIMDGASKTMGTVVNLWDTKPTALANLPSGIAGVLAVLSSIPETIIYFVATITGTFLVVLAFAVYMAHLVMSQISIYLALMFAPLFVPFLMFSPASWLFDGWLRFLLGASLMKIVGLLFLNITNAILAAVLTLSQQQAAAAATGVDALVFDITKYAVIILMAGVSALLMSSVPSIATGLLSGSGSGAGFSGWSSLASKSMATRGITGGMGTPSRGGSSGSSAPSSGANALSGTATAAPYALKPAVNGAGNALSAIGGARAANSDMKGGKMNAAGERNISRDTGKMSSATQAAYTNRLESANARMAKQASSSSFYGPPSPKYTVSKPVSSTVPAKGKG